MNSKSVNIVAAVAAAIAIERDTTASVVPGITQPRNPTLQLYPIPEDKLKECNEVCVIVRDERYHYIIHTSDKHMSSFLHADIAAGESAVDAAIRAVKEYLSLDYNEFREQLTPILIGNNRDKRCVTFMLITPGMGQLLEPRVPATVKKVKSGEIRRMPYLTVLMYPEISHHCGYYNTIRQHVLSHPDLKKLNF